LAAAAALSTGVTKDLDSCRKDVLAFLRMLRWRVMSVEVKLWTAFGAPHGTRKWEADGADYETLAESVARFITGSELETGAIVIARSRPRPNHSAPSFPGSPAVTKPVHAIGSSTKAATQTSSMVRRLWPHDHHGDYAAGSGVAHSRHLMTPERDRCATSVALPESFFRFSLSLIRPAVAEKAIRRTRQPKILPQGLATRLW
jgi:hypothetical protein